MDRYLKNIVSKSIVHMISYASFQYVKSVCIRSYLPHSDWTGKDTSYLFALSPNAENTGQSNSEYGHFSCSFFCFIWNILSELIEISYFRFFL